jgi:hypothetical protein
MTFMHCSNVSFSLGDRFLNATLRHPQPESILLRAKSCETALPETGAQERLRRRYSAGHFISFLSTTPVSSLYSPNVQFAEVLPTIDTL